MAQRLRQIDWYQFEKLVAVLYEEKGYRVERRGGYHPGARLMAQQQQVELLEEAQIVDWIESHRGRTSWPRIESCLNSHEKRCP